MTVPMIGNWSVQVQAVRPFTIHGDWYYELHVSRLDDAGGELSGDSYTLRVPQHAAATAPKAGDRVSVSFLMGQVTSVQPL